MDYGYKYFVLILLVSAVATVLLGVWKAIYGSGFSWFAVPWPLFIGIAILGGHYVYTVILWHQ